MKLIISYVMGIVAICIVAFLIGILGNAMEENEGILHLETLENSFLGDNNDELSTMDAKDQTNRRVTINIDYLAREVFTQEAAKDLNIQTRYPTTRTTYSPSSSPIESKPSKPNIIFILTDDLGNGNIGFTYESEGEKPSYLSFNTTLIMTKLAREEGRVMTRHYTASVCTPTRSAFQSGRLPIHVADELLNPCQTQAGMPPKMTGIAEVMQKGGYYTAIVGKWDAGMATREKIPSGRGYNESLVFYAHGNWMWTYKFINSNPYVEKAIIDKIPACDTAGVYGCIVDLWENDGPARSIVAKKQYEEEVFAQRVMSIINKVATMKEKKPLFLVYAPRVAHYPLEAPIEYQNRIREIVKQNANSLPENQDRDISPHRLVYAAMVLYLDDKINQIVDLLKKNKMWDNTLLVLTSDNGGFINLVAPCLTKPNGEYACPNGVAGATNYPLRGGKGSYFEGGIRVPTFISGGLIPKSVRGKPIDQMFHIADWYATFAYAGGVTDITDEKAKSYGLPPIDSINMWNILVSDKKDASDTSFPVPRNMIAFSNRVIMYKQYKLMLGSQPGPKWSPKEYPKNADAGKDMLGKNVECKKGCLFDIVRDKSELSNLFVGNKDLVRQLKTLLNKSNKTYFKKKIFPVSKECIKYAKETGFLSPWVA